MYISNEDYCEVLTEDLNPQDRVRFNYGQCEGVQQEDGTVIKVGSNEWGPKVQVFMDNGETKYIQNLSSSQYIGWKLID